MAQCEYCNRCDEDISTKDLKYFDTTDDYFLTSEFTTYCVDCKSKHEEEIDK